MVSLLTVAALKEKLKDAGLPTYGLKSELVTRLLDAGVSPKELKIVSEREVTPEQQSDESSQQATNVINTTVDPSTSRQGQADLLRRERDIAQREAELLRRELEMLRVTSRPETNTPLRAKVRKWQELKDLIGKFNGTNRDFDRWEKQMHTLLSTYDLSNHEAKALVCSKLTGKAQKWYHSRVDCVELSCDNLLNELKKMYEQRPDQLSLRRELEARTWKAGETFADYLHDKMTLANRVPVVDTEIISYVIEGIPSQELRTQAKVQCYQTIDAMLTAFTNVPAPNGAHQKPFQQRRTDSIENSKAQDKEQRKTKETGIRKCFNCNEIGHIAADCKKTK
ncbi:hypothetical protein ALC57_03764 [Trachymyrmex cornetzi]|uniref:CCHC-type domain-containing protein n=1 Tax=Trachymyrmex cornetzi TaxID=471704 RepID=A0A151JLR2_9HYME|nr:hypothetical protein ALC57_03764 [Trachymyrmex cornetzi]